MLTSSFLGLPYRIRNLSQKTELLRGLWVMAVLVPEATKSKLSLVLPGGVGGTWQVGFESKRLSIIRHRALRHNLADYLEVHG